MTIQVANTSNTNSLSYLINRVNELATAMSGSVVTVDSNTATGNASVNGTISTLTLLCNTALSGGNTSQSNTLQITSNVNISGNIFTVGSNLQINTSSYFIGNSTVNTSINSSSISLNGINVSPSLINVQTSGISSQVVDYFSLSTYRSAEYIITLTDNNANSKQSSKLLVMHDNSTSYSTEYAVIYSNTQLGNFSTTANATHCQLLLTPTSSNLQVKGLRTLVVV